MSKGKYAARASLRREDAGVRSDIASYQHHVKRLTEENTQLKDKIAAQHKAHAEESRNLRAMLDEGLSPEIIALREELERQRNSARQAEARRVEVQKIREREGDFVVRLLRHLTGCTALEAHEAVLWALGSDFGGIADEKTGADTRSRDLDYEAVTTLQRSRGFRSNPKVTGQLHELCAAAAVRAPRVRRAQ
jgi:chromosome segregation ATPase